MSMVDCRGAPCPQPVIATKEALDKFKEEDLIVIVDNGLSCKNVERFAQSHGYSVKVEEKGKDFYLQIHKETGGYGEEALRKGKKAEKTVVYINSRLLGAGDEALGSFLMKAFLKTLLDSKAKPDRLILINSGVQLASEDSKVLETLRGLSEKGMEILSCGTCIDFYGLKDKMGVGTISNMVEIIESLMEADHVIRP